MLRVFMKILSHTSQCEKEENKKGFRVSDFALLMVVFKWHHGSEGVKLCHSAAAHKARAIIQFVEEKKKSYLSCPTHPTALTNIALYNFWAVFCFETIVQELCESRGGRPGLFVLTSLLISVDVKIY